MTNERIVQIQNAIKAAQDAGDEEGVRVLMEGYAKVDSVGARKFHIQRAFGRAMEAGDQEAADAILAGYQKEFGGIGPDQEPTEQQEGTVTATVGGKPVTAELTPREQGRQAAREQSSVIGAVAQGTGSMLFGLGTPAMA